MAGEKNYWLMKSEPSVYSIDDLLKEKRTHWDGVRNFKARNYMKEMRRGDLVFFYHSSTKPPAIVGVARVCREAYPDFTQFDKKSKYFEPRARQEKPYWYMVDIEFVAKLEEPLPLDLLREAPGLDGMSLLKRGQRLSVQRVTPSAWRTICRMARIRPDL